MRLSSAEYPLCLDGRLLADGGAGTGVGQYARTILVALAENGIRPAVLESGGRARHRSRLGKLAAAARPGARRVTPYPGGYYARDIFREAQVFFTLHARPLRLVFPGAPGVMHWTYPLPLHVEGWRNLYTVHDALPLDPDIPSPVDGRRLRRMLQSLRAAGGAFVTVSEAARVDIIARMGWADGDVTYCHQAADVTEVTAGPLPSGLQPQGYLLYVGAVEARKNLGRLLDAYQASSIATPLVISGPDGLGAEAINAQIAATPGVLRLGLQPRSMVLRLIAAARALAFVSLAEGFGLPVAEAMTLGTPVLASDVAAVAEVAGDSALLVDPLDVPQICEGLRAIDADPALRARLVARGTARAQHFSIGPYAHRLQALYEER